MHDYAEELRNLIQEAIRGSVVGPPAAPGVVNADRGYDQQGPCLEVTVKPENLPVGTPREAAAPVARLRVVVWLHE